MIVFPPIWNVMFYGVTELSGNTWSWWTKHYIQSFFFFLKCKRFFHDCKVLGLAKRDLVTGLLVWISAMHSGNSTKYLRAASIRGSWVRHLTPQTQNPVEHTDVGICYKRNETCDVCWVLWLLFLLQCSNFPILTNLSLLKGIERLYFLSIYTYI